MPAVRPQLATRRAWMRRTLLAGGVLAAGAGIECGHGPAEDPFRGGSLMGNLPFEDEGQAHGIPGQDALASASPTGLDIGAGTPSETAVSILAEIIAVRNGAKISAKQLQGA